MKKITWLSLALTLSLLVCTPAAMAQSVSPLGATPHASMCYQYAKNEKSNSNSIRTCTMALSKDLLTTRDRAGVFVNRGILKRLDWQIKAAFDDYQSALKIRPNMPEAIGNRGNIYFLADRYERAIEDYQKSIALGISDDSVVRLNTAMALAELKRHPEAQAAYIELLQEYPEWELLQTKYNSYRERFKSSLPQG